MTTITLNATIQHNRGGHPFVEISEGSAAFAALRSVDGKYLMGSSLSGAKTFTAPVAITVNGVEHIATGVGAIYREETVTRERNPRNGKIRETVVKGPACCYVYLDESPVSRRSYTTSINADEREQWEQNPAGSASDAARREDY